MICCLYKIVSLIPVRIRNCQENAPKTGPPHLIFRRKIRAAKKWSSVGQQKSCQRPAALTGYSTDRGLIPRIDVRPLVAVHFYGDEIFVYDLGDLRVFVTLAIDHVA